MNILYIWVSLKGTDMNIKVQCIESYDDWINEDFLLENKSKRSEGNENLIFQKGVSYDAYVNEDAITVISDFKFPKQHIINSDYKRKQVNMWNVFFTNYGGRQNFNRHFIKL
jgi:hypothetical protein|tara:strand:+ start:3489 stop:3824 length:336 start_codon:yes stop_codon:yes gene_type:complete